MGRTPKNRNLIEVGNVQLDFLSEKKDNYDNDLIYFSITDKDWKTKMRLIQSTVEGNVALKAPFFMGDQGNLILRVKKKFVRCVCFKEFERTSYTADLVFEMYSFKNQDDQELTGYYCKIPCIQSLANSSDIMKI